jgi:hypothetical protein
MMSAHAHERTRPHAAIRADHSTSGPSPGVHGIGASLSKPLKKKTFGVSMEPGLLSAPSPPPLRAHAPAGAEARELSGGLP